MKRRTTRRRNSGGKTVSLRNFTGKVRRNPDGTVTILGRGKKKKARRNVAAGFYDEDGYFHPIRASFDYSAKRAGEGGRKRAVAKRRKRK